MRRIKNWWNAMVHMGTENLNSHDPQKRMTVAINWMSLSVGLLTITIGTFVWLITWNRHIFLGVAVESCSLTIPLYLNRHNRYHGASLSIYVIMSVATLYFGSLLGKAVLAQLMVPFLLGVSLFMFQRPLHRAICILLSVFIFVLLQENYQHAYIAPIQTDGETQILLTWSGNTAILILVILSCFMYRKNDKEVQTELKDYAAQVEEDLDKETQEHKNKDKFIINSGHEMKVSFYSIHAIIETLEDDIGSAKPPEQIRRDIKNLKAAAKVSQGIIDNIVEFQKFRAGIPTTKRENLFDPRVLFSNTVKIHRYMGIPTKVDVQCHFGNTIPTHIQSDDVKIRHVLSNLLHNAIKFAPPNSPVVVRCDVKNDTLIFSVKDDGAGIPEDIDIFAPFVTQNPEGLGIGLFIVKEFVTALNGKINVESGVDGTLFSISIPLHPITPNLRKPLFQHN